MAEQVGGAKPVITDVQRQAIFDTFKNRLQLVHGIDSADKKKVEAKRALGHQVEYLAGAMATLDALGFQVPAGWVIGLMSGRSVVTGL